MENWTPGTEAWKKACSRTLENIKAWLPQAEKAIEEGRPLPLAPPTGSPGPGTSNQEPTKLFNGMINPLVPYAIRGAIWYQGEANCIGGDSTIYYDKMKALIQGWRTVWEQKELSFYFVQLAPWSNERYGDRLPKFWEAQTATLSIPNTGMAVVTDITGNLGDIHPRNKKDVGRRLALWALAKDYGKKDLVYSGPLYKHMKVKGNKIIVSFDHVGKGLAARDDKPLSWFTVSGKDRNFVKADAKIVGDKVEVSSPDVSEPVAVRFAWSKKAVPNLCNKEGLPAATFRTDKREEVN